MKKVTINIRKYMVADPGCIMCNFDLAQAEARILSIVAPEPRMQKVFAEGGDLYRDAASGIYKVPYSATSKSTPEGAERRSKGKRTVLGCNYKMGVQRFAMENQLPYEEAKFLLDGYLRTYPGLPQYWRWVEEKLRACRTLQNCSLSLSQPPKTRVFLGPFTQGTFNEAYSWIPQSTVADIINERAIRHIYFHQSRYKDVWLIAQEHDGFRFQISLAVGWPKIVSIVRWIRDSLEQPIFWNSEPFVIPSDFSIGFNVRDLKELKDENFSLDSEDACEKLRQMCKELA